MCPTSIGLSQHGHRISDDDNDVSTESQFSEMIQFDVAGVGMGGGASYAWKAGLVVAWERSTDSVTATVATDS